MKRHHRIVGLALLASSTIFLSACGSDATFVAAADQFANVTVGPEYLAYVASDQRLSEAQKLDRSQNVASFRAAVAAKKER